MENLSWFSSPPSLLINLGKSDSVCGLVQLFVIQPQRVAGNISLFWFYVWVEPQQLTVITVIDFLQMKALCEGTSSLRKARLAHSHGCAISQEHLDGNASNLAHIFSWTPT